MKKNKLLKKNSFKSGALINTIGIFISKILGILYVIPFYAMIGTAGGALYGYAYSIYSFFINMSTAGIPLAISRVTSDYNTKGYYNVKKRAFLLARKYAVIIGIISFILIILLAPLLAKLVMGNLTGGNSLEDITLVIRVIAFAILVVPILSVYRGYIQGHMIMGPNSVAQVIEQLVRVGIIIVGSFVVVKLFKLSTTISVSVALVGATIGGICSLLYLLKIYRNNKSRFNDKINPQNEPVITNKEIIKLILIYAIPFIMIDVCKAAYDFIDTFTVVKGLVNHAEFTTSAAEDIVSMISTWGKKFNMIILSVNTGIIVSLIPSLSESITKEDNKNITKKINDSFSLLLSLGIPMCIGISILSHPIWTLFYGNGDGSIFLSYFIFTSIFIALFSLSVTIIQLFKDYRVLIISMLVGLVLKILLNYNLISNFYKLGLPPYYGVFTASIIGYFVTFVICILVLYKKYHIKFDSFINNFFNFFASSIIMSIILLIMNFIVPIDTSSRLISFFIIILYTLVGAGIYLLCCYYNGLLKDLAGNKINKIFKDKFNL